MNQLLNPIRPRGIKPTSRPRGGGWNLKWAVLVNSFIHNQVLYISGAQNVRSLASNHWIIQSFKVWQPFLENLKIQSLSTNEMKCYIKITGNCWVLTLPWIESLSCQMWGDIAEIYLMLDINLYWFSQRLIKRKHVREFDW